MCQSLIRFYLPSEEVGEGRSQQWRAPWSRHTQQPGQVGKLGLEGGCDLGHSPAGTVDQGLDVGVPGKPRRLAGNLRGRQPLRGQPAALAELLQLGQTGAAKL